MNTKEDEKKYKNGKLYIVYTILFIVMATIVFSGFVYKEKSFVWKNDGMKQHLPALTYYGILIREFFRNIFINHTFQLPMWDLSIGYGSDIITTLHYYVIGDPFCLLAAFVPASKTEYLYAALIILRLYFAGVTFSMYCKRMNRDNFSIVIGSLIYVFSGYVMYAGTKHPYFVNPMIFLPLLFIGMEKIYKKEKPHLFIIMTAISAISNFYFFYMLGILIVIYAIFRYIMIFKKIKLGHLFSWILKVSGYFLIGCCIAMIILLPNVMYLISSSRFAAKAGVSLFYNANYYYSTVVGFISSKQAGVYTKTGFSAIAMVSIIVLFAKKGQYLALKIAFILTTTFYMFPVFGHIFNGFSTVKNRWIFGYSLLIAIITVVMIPYYFRLKKEEKRRVIIGTVIYSCLFIYSMYQNKLFDQKAVLLPFVLFAVIIALILFGEKIIKSNRSIKIVVLCLTSVGICVNAYYHYYVGGRCGSYLQYCKDRGSTYDILTQTPSSLLDRIEDDTFYRYDRDIGNGEMMNSALIQNRNSVAYYFSVADGNISKFYEQLYLNASKDFYYTTLDNRSVLDLLASVKYFMIKEGETQKLPYSYDQYVLSDKINNKTRDIYTSENYLPFGYTYSNVISREYYDSLSVTKKQWAMLQGVVLDKETDLENANLNFTDKKISYTIVGSNNASLENNCIKVSKPNASITLKFNGLTESETYIILENINVSTKSNITEFKIGVQGDYQEKHFDILMPEDKLYCGRNSFLCNLGYNDKASTMVELNFKTPGEYTFDDLSIVCQPMDGFDQKAKALKQDTLRNIKITTNHISGNIDLHNSKLLLLSIPYSKGWTAYVDGKEQEVLQANLMYAGLELELGSHDIELNYETPYIRIGVLLSLFGIVSFIIVIVYWKRQKNKRQPESHVMLNE